MLLYWNSHPFEFVHASLFICLLCTISRARLQIITLILATIWYNSAGFLLHSVDQKKKSTTHQQFAWAWKALESDSRCYWFVGGMISIQWSTLLFYSNNISFSSVFVYLFIGECVRWNFTENIITFGTLSKCRDREWDQCSIGLFGFRSTHGIFKRNWFIHSLMWLKCILIVLFHLRSIMFISI